ncbi:amino acid ABC transporter permease [Gardnerella vaginalis]|uniref:ABC transporter permease n=7 Tax=Gardnerella TaxID=2701 RepID=A0A3E1IY90_GARVA|nr:amino acid ABC transporter permease [Gardnerella vaginalis]NSX26484.1 amino acid ABC transporter permease [Gardnerella vaginalis]RFD77678.1 ABC transporter permease [Gardnerella vaginalis]
MFNSLNKKPLQNSQGNERILPVKNPGPIVAGVIVAIIACSLLYSIVTNPRFEWDVVGIYLISNNVLAGIGWTLLLTLLSMVIAIVLAVCLAMMRKSVNPVLRGVSWFFIWFFRGTPVYTQLVFWGMFAVLVPKLSLGIPFTSVEFFSIDSNVVMTSLNAAVVGLSLNEAAYLSEIVRAGLEAVDAGQVEAAQALGMGRSLTMRRVVLPQAMRIIVPPLGNETIGMLKTTSLVLAVPFTLELQFATNAVANRIYKPIPLLIVASVWYLVITSVLMVLQVMLEKHFGKGFEAKDIVNNKQINSNAAKRGDKAIKAASDAVNGRNNATMLGFNA